MSVIGAISGGVTAGKKIVDFGKNIFGGGDDEPNPETANNLAQALSYMDRLDDMNKASRIANEMIKRGADGESYESVAGWADRQAGYNDGGPFRGIYPWDLIYQHWKDGVDQLKKARRSSQGSGQNPQFTPDPVADQAHPTPQAQVMQPQGRTVFDSITKNPAFAVLLLMMIFFGFNYFQNS